MQGGFEFNLLSCETSMSDCIVFVDEFNRKDWFRGVWRDCFLDTGSQLSQRRHKKREARPLTRRKLLDQSFWRQSEKVVGTAAVPTANGLSCSCSDLKRTVSYPCFAKRPSESHHSLSVTADATMSILNSQKAFDLSHQVLERTRYHTSLFQKSFVVANFVVTDSGGMNPCPTVAVAEPAACEKCKCKQTQTKKVE